MTSSNNRTSSHPIDPIFLERWSPRAFTGETMPEADLLTILEAAHWAPSSSNHQPWRFLYALKGSSFFETFLMQLMEGNQTWAKNASALVFILSRTHSGALNSEDQKPIYSHSFDAGCAWGYLALQARMTGYDTHGMAGIHVDKIIKDFEIPEGYRVEAAVAVGKQADKSVLPDNLQERETQSTRKPLSDVVFNGVFKAD